MGGPRSFAPDGNRVVGYDTKQDGFFWLIGQGGYAHPVLRLRCRALRQRWSREGAPPSDIMDEGLVLAEMSPDRF